MARFVYFTLYWITSPFTMALYIMYFRLSNSVSIRIVTNFMDSLTISNLPGISKWTRLVAVLCPTSQAYFCCQSPPLPVQGVVGPNIDRSIIDGRRHFENLFLDSAQCQSRWSVPSLCQWSHWSCARWIQRQYPSLWTDWSRKDTHHDWLVH